MRPLHIIAVDGLDCSGKSHFTRQLSYYLNTTMGANYDVRLQHFPDYDSFTGKQIKQLLYTKESAYDEEAKWRMSILQEKNRKEWYENLVCSENENTKDNRSIIIVADRYRCANDIYNRMIQNTWEKDCEEAMEREYGINKIPCADIQLFAICEPSLRKKRLLAKECKDEYEADRFQYQLEYSYKKYLAWYLNKFPQESIILPTHLFDQTWIGFYPNKDHSPSEYIRFNFMDYYFELIKNYIETNFKVVKTTNQSILSLSAQEYQRYLQASWS